MTTRPGTTLDPDHCPGCGGGEWEFLRDAHPVRIHCLGCNSVFTLGVQLVPALVTSGASLTPEQLTEVRERFAAGQQPAPEGRNQRT